MYKRRPTASLGVVAVLALAGCATTQVERDYDRDVSFEELETYTLIEQAGTSTGHPALSSPLVDRRIRSAIERELDARGFRKVTAGDADFKVAAYVVAEERLDVSTLDRYGYDNYGYRSYGYRRFGHPRYFGYGGPGITTRGYVREYVEGTLILDIIDASKDELIWRGWASKALAHDPKPEKVDHYVFEAVGKILEGFPPEA